MCYHEKRRNNSDLITDNKNDQLDLNECDVTAELI